MLIIKCKKYYYYYCNYCKDDAYPNYSNRIKAFSLALISTLTSGVLFLPQSHVQSRSSVFCLVTLSYMQRLPRGGYSPDKPQTAQSSKNQQLSPVFCGFYLVSNRQKQKSKNMTLPRLRNCIFAIFLFV